MCSGMRALPHPSIPARTLRSMVLMQLRSMVLMQLPTESYDKSIAERLAAHIRSCISCICTYTPGACVDEDAGVATHSHLLMP